MQISLIHSVREPQTYTVGVVKNSFKFIQINTWLCKEFKNLPVARENPGSNLELLNYQVVCQLLLLTLAWIPKTPIGQ